MKVLFYYRGREHLECRL